MFLKKYFNFCKMVLVISILLFFTFIIGSTVLAVPTTPATPPTAGEDIGKQFAAVNKNAGYGDVTDPRIIASRVIRMVLSFLAIIFLCLIVYAGFLWMTAGGNEDNIDKAKKLMNRAVIGLVIVLTAYSITWGAFKIALNYYEAPGSNVWVLPEYK